jgi:glycosyltransferase involved in cell wall biosynthesis
MNMKVIFCWAGISGYMAACWRELQRRPDIKTSLLCRASSIPWSSSILEGLPDLRTLSREELADDELIHELVVARHPDVVVLPGWTYRCFNRLPFYRDLAHCRFMLAMDNPWQGTWRQRLARLKIGSLIDRMDAVAVAGERCFQFARNLGVPEAKIMRGTYGIDYDQFASISGRRGSNAAAWPRRFLFAGRYEAEKGLDILVAAYKAYRAAVSAPWPLSCCGRGQLEPLVRGVEGIENHGFIQPQELPAIYGAAGAFLLASRFEPWGQVILEASASGLPVVCTEACGASVEAVRSFYSGLVVPTGDAAALCRAMTWIHNHHELLPQFGKRASQLAEAYSAQAWADRWTERFASLMA